MTSIHKKVVHDEHMNPIAVQIDYADWLEIARRLGIEPVASESTSLRRFEASIALTEDPVTFQQRMRSEWQ